MSFVSHSLLSRRSFLAVAAAGVLAPAETPAAQPPAFIPGIHLHSVDVELKRDFEGTLRRLAEMGYRHVELADLHGKSAAAWGKALKAAGLSALSAHYAVHTLQYDFDTTLDFAREIGLKYMVCAYPRASNGVCPSFEEWKWNAGFLNTIGFLTARAGIRFGYHNHAIEFIRTPAGRGRFRTGFDELIEGTDPKLVTFQLDCGWAAAARLDPAQLLADHKARFTLLHVRDVAPVQKTNPAQPFRTTAVGQGALDWKAILTAAHASGVQETFVALEPGPADALALLQQSAAFLIRTRYE